MKKKILISIIFVLSTITLFACEKTSSESKSKKTNAYQIFQQDYKNIVKNYKPDGFTSIKDREHSYSSTSFPENDYFNEKNDMVNDDAFKPCKRNLYYINKNNHVVLYITHMYVKTAMKKQWLTYDVPAQECSGENIPYFTEDFMTYRHTMVSFKTIYTGKDKKFKKETQNIASKAIQQYIKCLK